MSATNNSSKVRDNPADLHEDEVLMTWLQYPIDDGFERNYCADLFGEWPPRSAGEAAKAHPDVNMPLGTSLDMSMNSCAGSMSSRLSTKEEGSKSLARPASNAEDALALGAHRAAGLSSQVGQEAFNKVRTSIQPQAISQSSTPSSSLKPSIDRSCPVKHNLPVPSVPYACCKPIDSGVFVSPNSSRLYMCTSLTTENNTHAPPSESFTIASKRSRKDYETHSELSHTRQSGSSRITEDKTIKRGKMIGRDRKFKINPMSWSEGSQTSMSLSFREATYSEKHKLDDSDFLSEDADVESTDTRKPCKSSSRRNRVAEVHNLSERNRRNRINEKLKTLQDLIPNSCKTDKASMLDEAIEYTKTLQMQLQMVSMRSGMNVSPMMTPMAPPQTHMHMMPLHSVGLGVPIGHAGIGMGMGMGMGMDMGYPVNVPQYSTASPFQAAPASMSQYGVSFQTRSTTDIQDCNQIFTHMGFLPSQSLPPSDPMHPMSPSTPQMKQCQRQEQVQDLGHSSLNHCKHEAHVREQEGISDEKDWKRM